MFLLENTLVLLLFNITSSRENFPFNLGLGSLIVFSIRNPFEISGFAILQCCGAAGKQEINPKSEALNPKQYLNQNGQKLIFLVLLF